MAARGQANGKYQGAKWITREKRLALYLRDGLACAYCGKGIEDGITLSLDHLTPHADGGGNEATNLVTCCKICNSARGDRSLEKWCEGVAQYLNHGLVATQIVAHVRACSGRPYTLTQAKALIALRGGFTPALQYATENK